MKLRSRLFTAKNQAAVDGHNGLREQVELATQHDELATRVTDRAAVVATEVGKGLEVRRQPLGQPHELDIALGFALQAPAGLDAIEVAVDVDLQQHRWVVGRSTRGCRVNTFEAQTSEIEFVNEHFNNPDRVDFTHVVVQALGQQRDLGSILALDESLHVVARRDVATI